MIELLSALLFEEFSRPSSSNIFIHGIPKFF